MSGRTLALLLGVVLGLGAFIWFYERDLPSSQEREELERRVLDLERDRVSRLILEAGERRVVLERATPEAPREAGGAEREPGAEAVEERRRWRLAHPLEYPADYWAVDGLVRDLAELEKSRTLQEWEAGEVGLAEPRGKVTVELEDGERRVLLVGAPVPASSTMIVTVEGSGAAFVVADSLWESIEKEAGEWRDREVFTAQREEVEELLLAAGGETIRLERREDGDFWLTEPLEDRAEPDGVSSLLRELTGLRVDGFVDDPPPLAELGLEPPRGRFEVRLETGEPFVLLWGAATEEQEDANYARTEDLVFTTTADLETPLDRSPREWRARSWSSLPVYEIDVVELGGAQGTLLLRRDEGAWLRGEERIEHGTASDLLYAVDDARAERLLTPDEAPSLGAPVLTLRLASEGGDEERLELYAATGEGLFPARTAGRDVILLLPAATRDEILAKLEAVREAEALAVEAEEEEPDA